MPPEQNLKVRPTAILHTRPSVLVPHYCDKSQFVELLGDGEILIDVFWHRVKLYSNLTHIGEGSTEKPDKIERI